VTLVPELLDLSATKAFAAVREVGLQPVLIGVPNAKFDGYSSYRVAGQEPSAGREVDPGTRVALALAHRIDAWGPLERAPFAPPGSPAPELVGLNIEDATAQVTNAGFLAVVFQPERSVERLAVSRQEPEPGAAVGEFREIALWLD
jgi:beta-lactam-binding protein with PASTA domain